MDGCYLCCECRRFNVAKMNHFLNVDPNYYPLPGDRRYFPSLAQNVAPVPNRFLNGMNPQLQPQMWFPPMHSSSQVCHQQQQAPRADYRSVISNEPLLFRESLNPMRYSNYTSATQASNAAKPLVNREKGVSTYNSLEDRQYYFPKPFTAVCESSSAFPHIDNISDPYHRSVTYHSKGSRDAANPAQQIVSPISGSSHVPMFESLPKTREFKRCSSSNSSLLSNQGQAFLPTENFPPCQLRDNEENLIHYDNKILPFQIHQETPTQTQDVNFFCDRSDNSFKVTSAIHSQPFTFLHEASERSDQKTSHHFAAFSNHVNNMERQDQTENTNEDRRLPSIDETTNYSWDKELCDRKRESDPSLEVRVITLNETPPLEYIPTSLPSESTVVSPLFDGKDDPNSLVNSDYAPSADFHEKESLCNYLLSSNDDSSQTTPKSLTAREVLESQTSENRISNELPEVFYSTVNPEFEENWLPVGQTALLLPSAHENANSNGVRAVAEKWRSLIRRCISKMKRDRLKRKPQEGAGNDEFRSQACENHSRSKLKKSVAIKGEGQESSENKIVTTGIKRPKHPLPLSIRRLFT